MRPFTVEQIARVYDEEHGTYIEVGPDPDIDGCIRLSNHRSNGEEYGVSVIMQPIEARFVAGALIQVADHVLPQAD